MMENSRRRYHDWLKVALALAVVSAVLMQCIGAWEDSQTTDEAVHLAAGVLYWRDQAWLVNPEHPPLMKLLAGATVAPLSGLPLPVHIDRQTEPNQWYLGAQLLYEYANLTHGRWLLLLGRIPMILVWGAIAWLIYLWASRWWHPVAGAIAASLFLVDPNFLGHGHLITTDVGAAGATLLVVWCADRYWRQPTHRRLWPLAIVFGLAMITKFSLVYLWLIILLLGLVRLWTRGAQFYWRHWLTMMAGLVLGSALIIWMSYGFVIMRPADDPRVGRLWQERSRLATTLDAQPPTLQRLIRLTDASTDSGQAIRRLFATPIPAYPYWRGLTAIVSHSTGGHAAYLWGQAGYSGWWWYFPITMLLKTPVFILVLTLAATIMAVRRWWRRWTIPWSAWILVLPPLVYFLLSLTNRINIGLRHVLPIYPFLYLGLGWFLWRWWQRGRWAPLAILGGIVLSTLLAVTAYPHTIGYFNELAGGTNGGHRYLLDSNLDWNQDIWRLRRWLDRHTITEYQLSLFGSIPENRVFPEGRPVPVTSEISFGRSPSGIIVISANRLFNPNDAYRWLQDYQPAWRVGSSVYIFDFR